ncbi:MAG: hypothetical protein EOP48_32460, partial [Sphingobacteriales bacterium]
IDPLEIKKAVMARFPNKESSFYEEQVGLEKSKIYQHLPLKISLSRDIEESKEQLKIEGIEDSEGNDKPNKYFRLNYQTLGSDDGYWLDTCEFILNAR